VVQIADAAVADGELAVRGLSLLGGRLTLAEAHVGPRPRAAGLTVDGLPSPTGPNRVVALPDAGWALVLQQAVIPWPDGRTRRTTVALRVHLDVAVGGLPAGTEILIGHAAAARAVDGPRVGVAAEIPPELVPLYRAAGRHYGVPWSVLAAINRVETSFGRNLAVSSAGAVGWMQFMPATWAGYGYDADRDGRADPWDPHDAVWSAARLLAASGARRDLAGAVWRYNHSDRYVATVLALAEAYAAGAPLGPTDVDDPSLDETTGFSVVALW
jgi:soluble lytic murein transglycosylase-like protein